MVIDLLEHGMYVCLIRGPEGVYPMVIGGENSGDFSDIMKRYGNIIIAEEFHIDPEIVRKIGNGPKPALFDLVDRINSNLKIDVKFELSKICGS